MENELKPVHPVTRLPISFKGPDFSQPEGPAGDAWAAPPDRMGEAEMGFL